MWRIPATPGTHEETEATFPSGARTTVRRSGVPCQGTDCTEDYDTSEAGWDSWLVMDLSGDLMVTPPDGPEWKNNGSRIVLHFHSPACLVTFAQRTAERNAS